MPQAVHIVPTLKSNHGLEVIYSYIRETDDRTDLDGVTKPTPLVFTDSQSTAPVARA